MFWRKSNHGTLEAPRSRPAQKLDARAYQPLPDQDRIATEEAAEEAEEARAREEAAYINRFDDVLIRMTDTSEKTANILWDFYLRQEAKRYASPNGNMIGLAWAAIAFLVIGGIGTWIFGWRFWMYATIGSIFFLFAQIGVENANDNYEAIDPKTLPFFRRIAVFFHPGFTTVEGTVRIVFGLAIVSGIMAIAIAIIF